MFRTAIKIMEKGKMCMSNEELNTALYNKMFNEQKTYETWLKSLPTDEALTHAYEYCVREDILLALEYNDLDDDLARALLGSTTPLKDVFRSYENTSSDYMEIVFACIENQARDVIQKQREMEQSPLYRDNAAYAREHNELDAYRLSFKANVACKEAIETAIAENYSDNRLNTCCVKAIMERFGTERVAYVLAATVQVKDWDERFSRSNKEWAATISVVDDGNDIMGDRRTRFVVDRCHPGLTDLFITAFRKERQKKIETPPRKSIYEQLRQPVPQTHAPTPKKVKSASCER